MPRVQACGLLWKAAARKLMCPLLSLYKAVGEPVLRRTAQAVRATQLLSEVYIFIITDTHTYIYIYIAHKQHGSALHWYRNIEALGGRTVRGSVRRRRSSWKAYFYRVLGQNPGARMEP